MLMVTGTWKYERGLSRLMHDDLLWLISPQRVQYKDTPVRWTFKALAH